MTHPDTRLTWSCLLLALLAVPAGAWPAATGPGATGPAATGPPEPAANRGGGAAQPDFEPAGDDEMLETIEVVGKEDAAPRTLPGSFTVVDGEALERRSIRTLSGAGAAVPNLHFTEFSARRLSFPFLRGIGAGTGDPAVITSIDGVPQFGFGGVNLPLVDVERVEFLRGPQGTLYGRNSLGGLMNVVTRRPGSALRVAGRVGAGNYGALEAETAVSGPAGAGDDVVGLGLSARYARRDGFTTNTVTGNDLNFRQSFFGRAQVQIASGDNSLLRMALTGEQARDGGFVLSPLNGLRAAPYAIAHDFEGVSHRDVLSPSVHWERFGRDINTTVIGAYQTWEVFETADFDFRPIDGAVRQTEEDQDYFYLEARFASAQRIRDDDTSAPRWLVGVSGFQSDAGRSTRTTLGAFSPAPGLVNTESGEFDDLGIGLFGQATVPVTDDVDFTAGLRLDREEKEARIDATLATPAADLDRDFEKVLPRAALTWHPDDETTYYAQAARGFKAGGFNLAAPAGLQAFGTETNWTYEVGSKWDVGAVQLAAAAFFIEWNDMQLTQIDPLTQSAFVQNAGESSSHGVELEVEIPVSESLRLTTALGVVETEFDQFIDAVGNNAAGNSLPFAPDTTFALGAEYVRPIGEDELFLAGDLSWIGPFFYDAGNQARESYELLDLSAGYRRGRWSARLALRNALDEEWFPVAFQDPGNPGGFVAESGAPQTVLVTLEYEG